MSQQKYGEQKMKNEAKEKSPKREMIAHNTDRS